MSNQWVVGIAASVIGAVLYFLLSKSFEILFGKKAYYKNVREGNQEIIKVLRNIVSEGIVPEETIINSLISSYSRKYDVKSDDMYSIQIIKEELVKDLFETSFISTDRKIELSSELMKEDANGRIKHNLEEIDRNIERHKETQQRLKSSRLIQLVSVSMSMFVVILIYMEFVFSDNKLLDTSDFIPLLAVYISTITVLITLIYSRKKKRKE